MGFILLDSGKKLKGLADFNCFIIMAIFFKVLYLIERMGWLGP